MAPKKKVNKYDSGREKQWFGLWSRDLYEGSEEVDVDVFKKIEKRKVLSNVEKAGVLSKAVELGARSLGLTLSSIEKLGVFSKAEELGLLSLLENAVSVSHSLLASAALPMGLVAVQAVLAGALVVGATGLFVGSSVLGGLKEAD